MEGRIHSIESFGTVDGPGLRFVIFMQGCPMRCKYCHNPDSWNMSGGTLMSAQELMAEFEKNRPFYTGGGITVTGGEPLMQVDFLLELFGLAKAAGVHTCIDTSGITYRPGQSRYNDKLDALMALTDLVLLDIKHTDAAAHKELTSHDNAGILAFARYLEEKKIPVWIRHVLVPGITDDPEHLKALGKLMARLSNVASLDVLPYHTMGVEKYRRLGIPYPLEGVAPATAEQARQARNLILNSYAAEKQSHGALP